MKLIELYKNKVLGSISGLDRIRFRGTWRWPANDRGMKVLLQHAHILLKDFPKWAQAMTQRIRTSCEEKAHTLGIEIRYFTSSSDDKEKLARQIADDKGIKYVEDGNCFPWIKDIHAAQESMNQQLQTNWSEMLNTLTFQMCPDLQNTLLIPPLPWLESLAGGRLSTADIFGQR